MGGSVGEKEARAGGKGEKGGGRRAGGRTTQAKPCACRCTPKPTPAAHLCVAPGALLYQAPRHRAAHREALKDAPDEVTEAKCHQLLMGVVQV